MKFTALKNIMLAGLTALLLTGCLPVEDIRPAWTQAGLPDPLLAGVWGKVQSDTIKKATIVQFVKDNKAGYYMAQELDEHGEPVPDAAHTYFVKTVQVGLNKYMLITDLTKDEDFSGVIIPYKITEGRLEVFAMKPCDTSKCTNDLSQMADGLTKKARDLSLGFDPSGLSSLNLKDVMDFDTIYINYVRWRTLATYQKAYE